MVAINSNDVCLMILESDKSIIPIASSAFHVTQSSRKKLESYYGALLLTREGSVRRIQKIDTIGIYGETLGRKVVSALSGANSIVVHFDDISSIDLEGLKSLIIEYISIDSKKDDPYLPQNEELNTVFDRVKKSNSFAEVFDSLNIPSAENCLDVL